MSSTSNLLFAFVKKNKVIQLVRASENDSVILPFMVDDDSFVVKVSESTGFPYLGCLFDANLEKFQDFKPYDSWVFDDKLFEWVPPIAKPNNNVVWDEKNTCWLEIKETNGALCKN